MVKNINSTTIIVFFLIPEPQCGVNEVYSECSNGLCRVQNCTDKGKQRPCPPMLPGSCKPGCVCPENYLRNKEGVCVPIDQCETPDQGKLKI